MKAAFKKILETWEDEDGSLRKAAYIVGVNSVLAAERARGNLPKEDSYFAKRG